MKTLWIILLLAVTILGMSSCNSGLYQVRISHTDSSVDTILIPTYQLGIDEVNGSLLLVSRKWGDGLKVFAYNVRDFAVIKELPAQQQGYTPGLSSRKRKGVSFNYYIVGAWNLCLRVK